jgi:hypothetical protein
MDSGRYHYLKHIDCICLPLRKRCLPLRRPYNRDNGDGSSVRRPQLRVSDQKSHHIAIS